MATIQEKKDITLCNIFSSLQRLADLRRQYDRVISEGYINLSKARYTTSSSIGQIQYPNVMIPLLGITSKEVTYDELASEISDPLSLDLFSFTPIPREESEKETSKLRQRKPQEPHSKEENKTKEKLAKNDPIFWFSGLPPPPLRTSQQCFKQSIELAISIANTQVQIELLRKKYKTLSDSKEPQTLTPLDLSVTTNINELDINQ